MGLPRFGNARRLVAGTMVLMAIACGFRRASHQEPGRSTPESVVAVFPRGNGDGEIGIVPSAPGSQADGPEAIVVDSRGTICVLDKLNDRVLCLDPATRRTDALRLDPSAVYVDLVALGTDLWTWGDGPGKVQEGGRAARVSPRSQVGEVLASMFEQSAVAQRADDGSMESASRRRTAPRGPETAVVQAPDGQLLSVRVDRAGRTLRVAPGTQPAGRVHERALVVPATDPLGYVSLIGTDDAGNYYVLIEELPASTDGHTFVRTSLVKYDARGSSLLRYPLPITAARFVPRRPVAVARDGSVYFLLVTDADARILKLDGRPIGAAPDEGAWTPQAEAPDTAFEDAVRGTSAAARTAAAPRPIRRDEILARARGFLDLQWTPSQRNLGPDGSVCDPPDPQKRWKLPPRLEGMAGKQVVSVPYRWGGYESVDSFVRGVRDGKVAGNVCTCRQSAFGYCLAPATAGVDCSGFVSQAWDVPYHTTTGLAAVSTPLADLTALEPGDAVNDAGSHVRLIESRSADAVTVIESSTAKECQGVCRRTFRFTNLAGYRPIRRTNVESNP